MQEIDTSNGVIFPFYDGDTNMMYLCGKVTIMHFPYVSIGAVFDIVAVHEYANGTSAHDTVLEHRFSPTRTPFTS